MGGIYTAMLHRLSALFFSALLLLCLVPDCPRAHAAPGVSAQACVLMEAATGKLLFEKNGSEKRSVASTTKIMTTLLCLESGGLDDWFVVDETAIQVEGSSMGLTVGDAVTKRALCVGMLLPSGNDAANAAAVRVAGSIPAFAIKMNERAKRIGMTNTCFVTPSGLEARGHGASAADMALLAREALQNKDFREICAKPTATISFGNPPFPRRLTNTNKLLTSCEGVIGVKTGFTDEAGRCLVSACTRNGVTLICVTLHASGDWADHRALYDYGFSRVSAQEVALPEGLSLPVAGGIADSISLRADHIPTVGTDAASITARVLAPPFVYAPVSTEEPIAQLQFFYHERLVATVPLFAREAVSTVPPETKTPTRLERFVHWLKRLF